FARHLGFEQSVAVLREHRRHRIAEIQETTLLRRLSALGCYCDTLSLTRFLPASSTSSCLMLMIWSSRARNRSPDLVVSCFVGRIAPSDAATESCFSIRGNRENEFASFQGLRHGNLAISSQQSRQKTTLAQRVRNSSRRLRSSAVNPAGGDAGASGGLGR